MYGATAQGLEFDYCDPVPPDTTVEAEQLTARSNAAAVLVNAGFEPKGTLSAVGLPDIPFTGRPMTQAAVPAPADQPPADSWHELVAGLTKNKGEGS